MFTVDTNRWSGNAKSAVFTFHIVVVVAVVDVFSVRPQNISNSRHDVADKR